MAPKFKKLIWGTTGVVITFIFITTGGFSVFNQWLTSKITGLQFAEVRFSLDQPIKIYILSKAIKPFPNEMGVFVLMRGPSKNGAGYDVRAHVKNLTDGWSEISSPEIVTADHKLVPFKILPGDYVVIINEPTAH